MWIAFKGLLVEREPMCVMPPKTKILMVQPQSFIAFV